MKHHNMTHGWVTRHAFFEIVGAVCEPIILEMREVGQCSSSSDTTGTTTTDAGPPQSGGVATVKDILARGAYHGMSCRDYDVLAKVLDDGVAPEDLVVVVPGLLLDHEDAIKTSDHRGLQST